MVPFGGVYYTDPKTGERYKVVGASRGPAGTVIVKCQRPDGTVFNCVNYNPANPEFFDVLSRSFYGQVNVGDVSELGPTGFAVGGAGREIELRELDRFLSLRKIYSPYVDDETFYRFYSKLAENGFNMYRDVATVERNGMKIGIGLFDGRPQVIGVQVTGDKEPPNLSFADLTPEERKSAVMQIVNAVTGEKKDTEKNPPEIVDNSIVDMFPGTDTVTGGPVKEAFTGQKQKAGDGGTVTVALSGPAPGPGAKVEPKSSVTLNNKQFVEKRVTDALREFEQRTGRRPHVKVVKSPEPPRPLPTRRGVVMM